MRSRGTDFKLRKVKRLRSQNPLLVRLKLEITKRLSNILLIYWPSSGELSWEALASPSLDSPRVCLGRVNNEILDGSSREYIIYHYTNIIENVEQVIHKYLNMNTRVLPSSYPTTLSIALTLPPSASS